VAGEDWLAVRELRKGPMQGAACREQNMFMSFLSYQARVVFQVQNSFGNQEMSARHSLQTSRTCSFSILGTTPQQSCVPEFSCRMME
jgi:hypothetical protein